MGNVVATRCIVAKNRQGFRMVGIGALPARFRRPRLLIVGCGDVGQRVSRVVPSSAAYASSAWQVMALTSTPERVPALRAMGVRPLIGNLDDLASLQRLAGVATHVLHLAPPNPDGDVDRRTRALVRALGRRSRPIKLVYGSTTGVYGDCGGAWVNECASLAPGTARAHRRVSAETSIKRFARCFGVPYTVLRIPGIYAPDRAGGTPKQRLERKTPVLVPEADVFTNHIHADDLARACWLSLMGRASYAAVNVTDDSDMRMSQYMDFAAAVYQLDKPPRMTLEQIQAHLTPMALSFMQESRRLVNTRMKTRLGLQLRYPTVREGLTQIPQPFHPSHR